MKRLFTVFLSIMFVMPLASQTLQIHPKPQSVELLSSADSERISIKSINPKGADEYVEAFCETLGGVVEKKGVKLRIGTTSDRVGRKYSRRIKSVKGAYYIEIDRSIVVVGYDTLGLFYALNTLKQLIAEDGTLPKVKISDYPDVASRGVVEGFYGEPWSHEDRISLLNYFGKNRLNVYIYGPKDDTFHSLPNWRKPYPKKEADKIADLVKVAAENHVDFVWAIHPGQDIKWNDTDRDNIVNKFEMMYQLGVRSFAVFFDDISGVGTDATRQAELLNYLHDNFIAKKSDCRPLIMCPTEYNKSWSNQTPGTYLDILGDKLYSSIEVMWTGDRVISDITVDGMDYINKRLKRNAYIWWNFPVSDYVRDHLLLGRSYGLDTEAEGLMSGFVSNPMDKAEASKVAIYSIADYAWNISDYDSEQAWNDGMRDVMPKSFDAFKTFSMHNSDLGKNGHGYRREESVNMVKLVDNFYKTGSESDLEEINREFEKIEAAPATIRKNSENPNLIEEISPWLDQFEKLGESGQLAISMYSSRDEEMSPESRWALLSKLLVIREEQKKIDRENNQNPYQPGIESGSLVMQPFVDTLISRVASRFSTELTGDSGVNSSSLPMVISTTPQIRAYLAQHAGSKVSIAPVFETVTIEPNQYFGIKLPMAVEKGVVEFNFNRDKPQDVFVAEVSADGENWTPVEMKVSGHNCKLDTIRGVSHIRVVNRGDKSEQFHLRKFQVTSPQLDGESGNSFMALDGDIQSGFRMKYYTRIVNPKDSVKAVTFLLNSKDNISIDVCAIDSEKREIKIGVINSEFTKIAIPENLQSEIVAFGLTNTMAERDYDSISSNISSSLEIFVLLINKEARVYEVILD